MTEREKEIARFALLYLSMNLDEAVKFFDWNEWEGHCPDQGCPGILEEGNCSHCGENYKETLVWVNGEPMLIPDSGEIGEVLDILQ